MASLGPPQTWLLKLHLESFQVVTVQDFMGAFALLQAFMGLPVIPISALSCTSAILVFMTSGDMQWLLPGKVDGAAMLYQMCRIICCFSFILQLYPLE